MKNNKFRFKYSPLVWVLLVAVAILTVISFGWNVFNITEYSAFNGSKTITYAIVLVLDTLLFVCTMSVIICGYYKIDKSGIVCRLGIFSHKYSILSIVSVVKFEKDNKLVVFFKDKSYTVILIKDTRHQEFVNAIKSQKPEISYELELQASEE